MDKKTRGQTKKVKKSEAADAAASLRYTQNRELSWLKFNERVLEEAEDKTVPLLERLKFASIFCSNLDEFFMIRVGSLYDLAQVKAEHIDNKTGWSPQEQLDQIYRATRPLNQKCNRVFAKLERRLRREGIASLEFQELTSKETKYANAYFRDRILPLLSPQVVDPHHPFPHLQNKTVHVVAELKSRKGRLLGVIPVPASLPDALFLPGEGCRYIAVEKIICRHLDDIFHMYEMASQTCLCVTRNADISWEDEAYDVDRDFREKMIHLLKKRRRLAVVRLEVDRPIADGLRRFLCERLNIDKRQVYVTRAPLRTGYIAGLAARLTDDGRGRLLYREFAPQWPPDVASGDSMMRQAMRRDILLSFPYESLDPFLLLVREAAVDPAVVAIKITIYRLASRARLVEYLCAAAENGKDVSVLIELRARFDEQNNIDWSERLEEAGCKIFYGTGDYKVHSKVCLITFRERGQIRHIVQIGTGNYNENTAKLYTDLSLITANQEICADAVAFFNDMAVGNMRGEYQRLLVAPHTFGSRIMALIDEQIALGSSGRIIMKINSISDLDIMRKLSEASCAGVKIDLIVRGICCILPGIPGYTENIRIISIVGRFLEHSRIYVFGDGDNRAVYLSSGDMLTRNMERRVEVACPVYAPAIVGRILRMLDVMFCDTQKARRLDSRGHYAAFPEAEAPLDSQEYFMREAVAQGEADRKG